MTNLKDDSILIYRSLRYPDSHHTRVHLLRWNGIGIYGVHDLLKCYHPFISSRKDIF